MEESAGSQGGLPVPGGLANARGSPASTIRILLVNSERLALEGMRRILDDYSEFSVVATARDGTSALRQIHAHRPHLVLIELGAHLSGMGGLETTRNIRRRYVHTKVVIMSSSQQPFYMREAFLAGAHGYLSKNINPGEFRDSLRKVYRSEVVFPRDMAGHVLQMLGGRSPVDGDPLYGLNGKERQIFFMMAHGHDTQYIATALRLSPKTVRNYSSRIYKKLGTGDRVQTVLYAGRWIARSGPTEEAE